MAEVPDESADHLRVEVGGVELDHVQKDLQKVSQQIGGQGTAVREEARKSVEQERTHSLFEVEDVLSLLWKRIQREMSPSLDSGSKLKALKPVFF